MDKNGLIALYFSKKLSLEAQKEFDHLMATDSEFAKEVNFQENIKVVIEKEERELVKQQLQDFETQENASTNYTKWLVAASAVVLLGVSSFWYFNNTIDPEKLYVENFEPYRNVVQPIVRSETRTDIKTKAFAAYETKNYEDALDYFDTMLNQKYDATISFYKANILLQLNDQKQAINILSKNLKVTDSLIDKHQWYLALAYLKNNDLDKAKNQLNDLIASPSTFKKEDAKYLLKKLK